MAAFDQAISRTPVAIRDISVVLVDYVASGDEPARQAARFEVQVEYDNGEIITKQGDLVPYITQAQIDALIGFIAGLRVQAVEQILPEGV
jgi:hypothetical protein